jgi:hypothetical protein
MSKFLTMILLSLVLLRVTPIMAQSASQLEAQLGSSKNKKVKNWGISLSSTTLSSVKTLSAYDSKLNTSVSGTFRYNTPYFNTRLFVAADKDLVGSRQDRFSSAFAEISNRIDFLSNSDITTLFQGRYNFAVNDELRRQQSYRGGISAGLLMIGRPADPDFQIIFISRVTKNFHEFKIARDFSKNVSINNVNTGILSYSPYREWELSFYGSFVSYWNYDGDIKDSYYTLGQSVSYNPSSTFSLTLGHENGGFTYGYYGNNLDLSLLDTNSSVFYGTLTLNF